MNIFMLFQLFSFSLKPLLLVKIYNTSHNFPHLFSLILKPLQRVGHTMIGGKVPFNMDRLHECLYAVRKRTWVFLLVLPLVLPSILSWLVLLGLPARQGDEFVAVLPLVPLLIAVRAEHSTAVLARNVTGASNKATRGG